MSLYNIASRVSRVEIEVKSKVSRNNPTFTGTVTGITKGSIGLGSVDNTSDADKGSASQSCLHGRRILHGRNLRHGSQ